MSRLNKNSNTNDICRKYQNAMSLCKERLVFAESVLDRHTSILEIEITALQVRKICESLSYACLAAFPEGNALAAGRLKKAYRADQIIKTIIRHDEGCFPRPVHVKFNFETRQHSYDYVESFKPVWKYVCDLYNTCDRLMHEFKPDRFPSESNNPTSTLRDGLRMLRSLLSVHVVKSGSISIICIFGEDKSEHPKTIVATRS